jgi:carboxymethylenebutenolidase
VSVRRTFFLFLLLAVAAGCQRAPGPAAGTAEREVVLPAGGKGRGLLLVPGEKRRPALIVLHDVYGLDDAIRRHARRLAGRGFVVLAVDLYRGEKVDTLMHAHEMDRALPEEQVRADLRAAVDFLLGRDEVQPDALGIIGWGMGGGYALDAAIAEPRLRACVNCGGRLSTDPAQLRRMKAAFLGLFAGKDEGNPPETLAEFRTAMKEAGRELAGLHVFADCDAGYMNPAPSAQAGPPDEKATEQAWERIDDFLARKLGGS